MTGKIFINYRRDDAGNAAGRLYDRLEVHFGPDKLFIDVDKILGGLDFVEELNNHLSETEVMLAVIGRQWLTLKDNQTGERRIDNKDDFVRKEIETALDAGIEIIPILVDGADMPGPNELPESLKLFSRRNAMRITLERFRSDAQGIINSIEHAFDRRTEHRKEEENQQKREAEKKRAQEHDRQLEAARNEAMASLNSEQIIIAEAVANWDFIKDSKDEEEFRNHIARYQSHEASLKWAKKRLEDLVWSKLGDAPNEGDLQGFIEEFPNGKYAIAANEKLHDLISKTKQMITEEKREQQEKTAWEFIKNTNDVWMVKKFIKDYPKGRYAKEATQLIRAIERSKNSVSWRTSVLVFAVIISFIVTGVTILLQSKQGGIIWRIIYDQSAVTIKGHTASVTSVTFSPDGSKLASASYDKTIRIWDANSYQELAIMNGHSNYISSVAFSPDSRRLVSGAYDQSIKIWNTGSYNQLASMNGHFKPVTSVAFSPDGKMIVSGSWKGSIRVQEIVHDALSPREHLDLALKGHLYTVNSVTFSSDGSKIASASRDKTIRIWDAKTFKSLAVLKGHSMSVLSVTFSPDGSKIASASHDRTIRIWDAKNFNNLGILKGHSWAVISISFSPDGSKIVSGSGDNTIRIWDMKTYKQLAVLKGHTIGVNSVSFSPDGRKIVSGAGDNSIKIWNVPEVTN